MDRDGDPGIEREPRTKYYRLPTRVVWTDAEGGTIEGLDALLRRDGSCCVLQAGPRRGPAVVLDFGEELNGGVLLDVFETRPEMQVKVRLRFGESVSEVMGTPNNDHAIHDLTLDLPGMSLQEFGMTGFRFVRLDLLSADCCLTLRQVKAAAVEHDLEYKGQFDCSDPRLNRIWAVGARTVHLCCQDYIYDGIKRDRLVWVGDLHPELHIIAAVFGGIDLVPRSLNIVRDRTPQGQWMNGISSYSLWWIISVWDWFEYTADRDFLESQKEYLGNLVAQLIPYIDAGGRERLTARFFDWFTARDEQAVNEGIQTLFVWAMTAAGKIFAELGDPAAGDTCATAARRLSSCPRPLLASKQVNAIRVLAGLTDARAVNDDCLAVEPHRHHSPWFGYYVLQARTLAGDYAGCLDLIRTYWGGMLDLGATTFWEHFDVRWLDNAARIDEPTPPGKHDVHAEYGDHCFKGLRHSLCHGWAGGPTAWLSKEVLGIHRLAPGFRKVRIQPHLEDLTYAKGTFPTPQGLIRVEHVRRTDGRVESQVDTPPGVEVVK